MKRLLSKLLVIAMMTTLLNGMVLQQNAFAANTLLLKEDFTFSGAGTYNVASTNGIIYTNGTGFPLAAILPTPLEGYLTTITGRGIEFTIRSK